MNILFVMHYPGYLRYYDSTVRLLAERGHTIYLAFDSLRKQREGLEALEEMPDRVVVVGAVPARKDDWTPVARGLRGAVDFARYLHPRFADAYYLRQRMEKVVPSGFGWLRRVRTLPTPGLRLLLRGLLVLERAIPSSPTIETFIRSVGPDVVLMTPLVTDVSPQTDLVKSAHALGIRTGLCVASWDHLTTKGLIRLIPKRVFVWNDVQRAEAVEFHGVPASNIIVTGAQPFDRWFERQPSMTRESFCQKVGLRSSAPFLLFVGSTASISAPAAEQQFVRRWIQAIRLSRDPTVRDLPVLVRPHPYNPGLWATADLSDLGDVAIWPRGGANPVNENDRADYFDSLYYSAAVVGINTSAMIEAAIVGRPVHTILTDEFADTQAGTLHFHYLLAEHGGFLRVARSLDEHVIQLAEVMRRPEVVQQELAYFVGSFVRPHGLARPCTPILVDAIEQLGRAMPTRPERMPVALHPLRLILWLIAWAVGRRPRTPVQPGVEANSHAPGLGASHRILRRSGVRKIVRSLARRARRLIGAQQDDERQHLLRIEKNIRVMQKQLAAVAGGLDKLSTAASTDTRSITGDPGPAQDEALRTILERLGVLEKQLSGMGIEGRLRHMELHVQAILRKLYIDPAALPFPYNLTVQRFRLKSQNEEDGITLALLDLIQASSRRFVDLGFGTNGGNSGFLAQELGWQGLMVDASEDRVAAVRRTFNAANVTAVASWITRENVDDLLRVHGFIDDVDILSIDIDGNDYWLWEALTDISPRLVIIEYNSFFGPDRAVVVPYDPEFDRHRFKGIYYGASLAALAHLASRKGYRLVTTEPRGVNAYFVRNDVAPSIPTCDVRQAFRLLDKYDRAIRERNQDLYQFIQARGLPLVEVAQPVVGAAASPASRIP